MEGSQIASVRKFIKQTLNLSDGVKIADFSLEMNAGQMSITATISLGVDYQELSSLQEIPTNGKPRASYTPSMKEKAPRSKMPMKTGSFVASRSFEATASDFHCIKVILRGWRKIGKLTENELDVIVGYSDKRFASMTQEEKQTFLQFFYAVRSRLDQKAALSSGANAN